MQTPPHPMPALETRRKRAIYRAEHRGTKELDLLLGQFSHALLDRSLTPRSGSLELSDDERIAVVEWLIAQPDHALQPWLINPNSVPDAVPAAVRFALLAFRYHQSASVGE